MEGAETELESAELLHLKFHLLVPLLHSVILVVLVVRSNIDSCGRQANSVESALLSQKR